MIEGERMFRALPRLQADAAPALRMLRWINISWQNDDKADFLWFHCAWIHLIPNCKISCCLHANQYKLWAYRKVAYMFSIFDERRYKYVPDILLRRGPFRAEQLQNAVLLEEIGRAVGYYPHAIWVLWLLYLHWKYKLNPSSSGKIICGGACGSPPNEALFLFHPKVC